MPRTIEVELYQFNELEDDAKEKAREWYRSLQGTDTFWSETVIDDADTALALCGFFIHRARGSRVTPAIYFSGFWSQGDGACFEGSWHPESIDVEKIRTEYPAQYERDGVTHQCESNTELLRIAEESARLSTLDPAGLVSWTCKPDLSSSHENSVRFDYNDERNEDDDGNMPEDIEDAHKQNARDAMRWVYRNLEREWEWFNSDEQVDESIRANGYEFTKEGKRA